MSDVVKFNGLSVSSKFSICGLPIRYDTYKTCSFGCKYCFSDNRCIMKKHHGFQIANIEQTRKYLNKPKDQTVLLDNLVMKGITWHCGGMSDPLQPCESEYNVTRDLIELSKEKDIHILFSTKTDRLHNCKPIPELHTFQLSVSNIGNRKDIEPNVPDIVERKRFFDELKDSGFKVGIRIQPFIPNITSIDIIDMFQDADHFSIEGIKAVPQNIPQRKYIKDLVHEEFKNFGLMSMLPDVRLKYYQDFINKFEELGLSYSIADNDLHYIGNNKCCCGDALVNKSSGFDSTAIIKKYGDNFTLNNCLDEMGDVCDCKCNQLFYSNRWYGCMTCRDFVEKRFGKKSAPLSPNYQYHQSTLTLNTTSTNK